MGGKKDDCAGCGGLPATPGAFSARGRRAFATAEWVDEEALATVARVSPAVALAARTLGVLGAYGPVAGQVGRRAYDTAMSGLDPVVPGDRVGGRATPTIGSPHELAGVRSGGFFTPEDVFQVDQSVWDLQDQIDAMADLYDFENQLPRVVAPAIPEPSPGGFEAPREDVGSGCDEGAYYAGIFWAAVAINSQDMSLQQDISNYAVTRVEGQLDQIDAGQPGAEGAFQRRANTGFTIDSSGPSGPYPPGSNEAKQRAAGRAARRACQRRYRKKKDNFQDLFLDWTNFSV